MAGLVIVADGVQWETRENTCRRLRIKLNTLDKWRQRGLVTWCIDRDSVIWVDFDAASEREMRARVRATRGRVARNRNNCHHPASATRVPTGGFAA